MPLLIVPLVVLVLLALWLLLLPVSLWQRYRMGKARRRARPWLVRFNAWALLVSLLLFVAGMALTNVWWPGRWPMPLPAWASAWCWASRACG
jgi:hypothetical protein